jgi:hypothetical protein
MTDYRLWVPHLLRSDPLGIWFLPELQEPLQRREDALDKWMEQRCNVVYSGRFHEQEYPLNSLPQLQDDQVNLSMKFPPLCNKHRSTADTSDLSPLTLASRALT